MYLVFAIDGGELVWLAAYDMRDAAIAHINELEAGRYEFAFTVESAHFKSFV